MSELEGLRERVRALQADNARLCDELRASADLIDPRKAKGLVAERERLTAYQEREAIALAALRKIDEPIKFHHWEEDAYTRAGCFQFVASEARKALGDTGSANADGLRGDTTEAEKPGRGMPASSDRMPNSPPLSPSSTLRACQKCGQTEKGQTGEYPCSECGLPTTHDSAQTCHENQASREKGPEEMVAEFHGCFTGDCPHQKQEECMAVLREEMMMLGLRNDNQFRLINDLRAVAQTGEEERSNLARSVLSLGDRVSAYQDTMRKVRDNAVKMADGEYRINAAAYELLHTSNLSWGKLLPGCLAPEGAEPCGVYTQVALERDSAVAERDVALRALRGEVGGPDDPGELGVVPLNVVNALQDKQDQIATELAPLHFCDEPRDADNLSCTDVENYAQLWIRAWPVIGRVMKLLGQVRESCDAVEGVKP